MQCLWKQGKKEVISLVSLVRLALTCISVFIFCTGCTSIITGKTQQIAIESAPNKAYVYINGVKTCETPCSTAVQRSKVPPKIEIKKDGYEDGGVALGIRTNYWLFADLLFGAFSSTSFAVDLTTNPESTVEYEPGRYFVTLDPLKKKAGSNIDKTAYRSNILKYIAITYSPLSLDISRGTGEHLEALYDLLDVRQDEQSTVLLKLRELSAAYPDTIEFARAVDIAFSDSAMPRTGKKIL
jgi:PEGA domain